ncbi:putative cationic amino acid transporter [Dioscorea sansibarensis]
MTGISTASIALFTDLEIVLEMISIGTLVVFYLVANALIYRRYVKLSSGHPSPTILFLLILSLTSIGFSLSWKLNGGCLWGLIVFGLASVIITGIFHRFVPCYHRPSEWSVPLMPWPAASSIFLNVFLMNSLKKKSFQRFGIWSFVVTLFYVLYGVHSTYHAEEMGLEVDLHDGNSLTATSQTKLEVQVG